MFVRQFMERIGADTLHFLHYYDHMAQSQAFSLALPLGELSPKVTERALQALLNGNINLCTHAAKIPVDVSVENRRTSNPSAVKNAERSES